MPSSVRVRADRAETSDDSRRYPQYCYWRNLIHSRQSDQNSRRYRRLRQSLSRKKRDLADGEKALKEALKDSENALKALTINTTPAALVRSQPALRTHPVSCEYIPAGPRRGPLQAYAHIGQDWWSLEGGSNDAQFAMVRRLTSLYNSPIAEKRNRIRQCPPGWTKTTLVPPERPGSVGSSSTVTVTKMDPDFVAKSEALSDVRMARAMVPSDYIRTETGQFVSLYEAALGRHILVPLKRMCASTYDEGECRRWEAVRMADSQRERNSQKNTGTTPARLIPSLAKLGTSKSVPLMNSRG